MKLSHAIFLISTLASLAACKGESVGDTVGSDNDSNHLTAETRSRERAEAWFSKTDRGGVVGGQCAISCHSTIPFVVMNPMTSVEDRITADAYQLIINKRITDWANLQPLYSWSPTASRSTEALLNAVSALEYDRKVNKNLTATACKALENLWALQLADGHFEWLNASLSPWEDSNAPYFSASLLSVSVARLTAFLASNNLQPTCAPWVARVDHMAALHNYLKQNYTTTNKHGQAWFLWANSESNYQLATPQEHDEKLSALLSLQRSDGGFDLNDFGPFAHARTGEPMSQPYITKIMIKALGNPTETTRRQALEKAKNYMVNFPYSAIDSLRSLNDPASETKNGFTQDANLAYYLND